MQRDSLLGQINGLHQMLVQLTEQIPAEACQQQLHPQLAPLVWYLGRAGYIESYWLREVVQGDDTLTAPIRALFSSNAPHAPSTWQQLPPREHLLNWLLELQDENIMRLANPGRLPAHPLLEHERLHRLILQALASLYEQMIQVITAYRLAQPSDYRVATPLRPAMPTPSLIAITQGHYRVGALDDPAALDCELPTQMIQLSNFRIDSQPVSNCNYLAFMEAGGYQQADWWSTGTSEGINSPNHWRQDSNGAWYGVGINGPFDLPADEPVAGISHPEASAYANWLAAQQDAFNGAVLQHEYQWEVAVRTGALKYRNQVREWCANRFAPYDKYQQPEQSEACCPGFAAEHYSLRGGSLHTQPIQQRASHRSYGLATARHLFCGTRLVFPPE